MLKNMKVGERGQVTIPQNRDRFGIGPETEVEFSAVGRCARSFKKLGYSSVEQFIEDIRGR
jgi:bifunctional DNA-binding transcriptional regulator/antitoxin component of YhaV-PrlF toxin-antitoxin module